MEHHRLQGRLELLRNISKRCTFFPCCSKQFCDKCLRIFHRCKCLRVYTYYCRCVSFCRQQLAKSSVSKYTAMANMVCEDGRARGCFQFYGTNRSGRWAGRGIQLQNLPQNHMSDLAEARSLVRDGNFDALDIFRESSLNLSEQPLYRKKDINMWWRISRLSKQG